MKSGYVMKQVEIVRYERDRVVLKHAAGVDPVGFKYLAEPDRQRLLEYRQTFEQLKNVAPVKIERSIKGEVFVTTVGAGAYKFSGTVIYVFPERLKSTLIDSHSAFLPLHYKRQSLQTREENSNAAWSRVIEKFSADALTTAVTDSKGEFHVTISGNEAAFLLCFTSRLAGRNWEHNTWIVDVGSNSSQISLNNLNLWEIP